MARICVVRQAVAWSPRAAREVRALADAGHTVELICVREGNEPLRQRRGSVTTWSLPVRSGPQDHALHYLLDYGRFFVLSALLVTALHLRRPFDLVQVNSLPDLLVLAACVPRATGTRVLLDLQECMPEFYATKFKRPMSHPAVRLIVATEQLAVRFAHHVVTPTPQLKDTFVARGADESKIDVVYDGSDPVVFHPLPHVRPDPGCFTVVSHGTVEERYGLDTAVRAVAALREEMPELRLRILGSGTDVPRLERLAAEHGVGPQVQIAGRFVPQDELVWAIASSDVGLVAMKRDAFRDLTLTCKMFDFLAMDKPMIISRTRSVEETIPPDAAELFESDDPQGLADAVRRLHNDEQRRTALVARAHVVAQPLSWDRQRQRYLAVVDRLLAGCGGRISA